MGTSKCTQKKKAVPARASSHSSISVASSPAPATTAVSRRSSQSKHPRGSLPGQQALMKEVSQMEGLLLVQRGFALERSSIRPLISRKASLKAQQMRRFLMAGWSSPCYKHYFMPPSIDDANPAIV
ncbi:hypothetical protein BDP27DRAFT_1430800 [Rhodocollybia butyracea]|uniref:Uncharacterized protein n=1 Tax=Rhodocollybia butyracea TaxID=206335 RepID=A0A9P5TZ25_9AGAR|nr:hypothetical protein BDP27DRAFT_1430800 [Rhodocollybia butyracea]